MDKLEKIKSEVLDLLNQNRNGLQLSRITHTLLGVTYVRFKKIVMTRSKNPLIGKMEVFRKTINFMEMLYDELVQLEKELTETGTDGVEYYFPDEKELVETIDVAGTKVTVIKEMAEPHHWKRANKQIIDEQNNVVVSGLKGRTRE